MMPYIQHATIPREDAFAYFMMRFDAAGIDPQLPALQGLFSEGEFSAIVPTPIDVRRLVKFKEGMLLPANPAVKSQGYLIARTPDTIEETSMFLASEMAIMSSPVFYVNEAIWTEEELRKMGDDPITLGPSIYLAYKNSLTDPVCVAHMLGHSTLSWHFLGFILDSKVEVPANEDLWKAAKMIVVGAYDGESYLYWKRRSV